MSPYPLVGLDVHVAAASERDHDRIPDAFVGLLAAEPSDWHTTVLRSDGRLCSVANERVTFRDPCRAARMLRARVAHVEAHDLNVNAAPEYTPPRWVPTHEIAVGTRILAGAQPDGSITVFGFPGCVWTEEDYAVAPIMPRMRALVGEWPPLPEMKP